MAHVIKSNKALANSEGALYVTELGLATKRLKDYLELMKIDGYTLTQTQFDALKAFDLKIISLGIESNLLEILPLMGTTISNQLVKFKYKNLANGTNIYGMNLAENGDGGKGLKWPDYRVTNAQCIDIGLTDSDFPNGFGLMAYVNTNGVGTASQYRTLLGKGASIVDNAARAIIVNEVNELTLSTNGNAVASVAKVDGVRFISAEIKINPTSQVITERKSFSNGNLIFRDEPNISISSTNSINYTIGARNTSNGGNPQQGFHGYMRLAIVTDGNIPLDKYIDFVTACEQFIVTSGKTFV